MSIIGKSVGRPINKTQFERIVKQFIVFAKKELRINFDIPIHFVDDAKFAKNISSFGEISSSYVINVSIINRHPMDVLQTLAFELDHYKQYLTKRSTKITSNIGSVTENQANAKAGEIVKKFGSLHPEYYELTSIK